MLPSTRKLPVTIITGFLGSGKTTLLNHILENFDDRKVAVLVNEFGDINIDSQLLMTVEEDVIELTNGCICCTINDSLLDAVYRVLERGDSIDYLVLETTGVADPLPIMLTFLDTALRDLTQLDAVITVIDAETFDPQVNYGSDAALSQIKYGDIVLLNKADCVPVATLQRLEAYVQTLKDKARVLHTTRCQIPLSLILNVQLADTARAQQTAEQSSVSAQHLRNDGFVSVSFTGNRPFALTKFQEFLAYRLPDNVFRAKGILWFEESPKRHLFQLSGNRFTLDNGDWATPPKTEMMLIGRQLDVISLMQILNNCLVG